MNILLSGASSGVGFEAVIELIANKHHKIIALARSEEKLNKLQEIAFALNPGCSLSILKFDIAHDNYENILIPFVKEKLGTVDVLINNAGSLINKNFMQTTPLDFAEMLQNNFLGLDASKEPYFKYWEYGWVSRECEISRTCSLFCK